MMDDYSTDPILIAPIELRAAGYPHLHTTTSIDEYQTRPVFPVDWSSSN